MTEPRTTPVPFLPVSVEMTDLLLAKVELLNGSRVAITPARPNASYQYVYRAALGVEWNNELGKFFSPSDYMLESRKDWTVLENMDLLVVALKDEMGLQPIATADTEWVGFDEPLRRQVHEIF